MSKHFISSTLNNNLIHCTDETDLNTALTVGNVGKVYELNNTVYEVDTGGSSFVNKPYKDDVGSGAYRFKRYRKIPDYLCFTANANTNIAFTINGTLTTTPVVQYSYDKLSWNNYTFGNTIALTTGQTCYWKGDNNSWSESTSNYIGFSSTSNVSANGNIMSLLDSSCHSITIPTNYCFCNMFNDCTKILTAPKLPATILTTGCYYNMFQGCTQLTVVPNLPATSLVNNCYYCMFANCRHLYVFNTSLPEYYDKAWVIPTGGTATGERAIAAMFIGTIGDYGRLTSITLPKTLYTQNEPV